VSASEIRIDDETGDVYIKFRNGKIYRTKEVRPELLVDMDLDGEVIGVEYLAARRPPIKRRRP
jgi:uncharacterized protein YuzE